VKLVAGLFEIRKPYFNLDASNRYQQLGSTENAGLEISVSGPVLP
jgi:iron complex outermembrane receptor protein